jgi:transposase-like protein
MSQLMETGLADITLGDLLGSMMSSAGAVERSAYLNRETTDKANGFYERQVHIGSVPVNLEVPRTRSGKFRPSTLPPRYQRGYSDETQALLLNLLSASRSVNAAREALHNMGLSICERELDAAAVHLIEEFQLRNNRPIDPDMLAVMVDGKYVEIREGDQIRPACIYVVAGIGRDGKKRVLSCTIKMGRENLEDWKAVLRNLCERGLRRVLLVIQDDFSGLLGVSKGMFARADVQLCVVHMQRNAKSHLSKADSAEFQQRWRTLRASWNAQTGAAQFEELCARFADDYPSFVAELRKKREHYLAFLNYPDAIRRSLSTTNNVEAINGQLEKIRRNSGGYFQSEDTLKMKLGITVTSLESGRWAKLNGRVQEALHQLNALFQTRFESED